MFSAPISAENAAAGVEWNRWLLKIWVGVDCPMQTSYPISTFRQYFVCDGYLAKTAASLPKGQEQPRLTTAYDQNPLGFEPLHQPQNGAPVSQG
jgi:hypothetical protein